VGGLVAGLAIGVFTARQQEHGLQFFLAAALIASATGILGCSVAGVLGIVGMVAGGAVGLMPGYLRQQLR
jgi:hypothetical protein